MKQIFFYIKILSSIGLLLAIYLLWQQFFRPEFQPCSINDFINCDAVIKGPVAKTFGIPTPLIGLIGYIVIFLAAHFDKKRLLLFMSAFGLIFCLSIAYIELFQLKVICPICIACQIVILLIFLLAIKVNQLK